MATNLDEYCQIPDCKLCMNSGVIKKRVISIDDQIEYGALAGEEVMEYCSECRWQKRLRLLELTSGNLNFEKFFNTFSDYKPLLNDEINNFEIVRGSRFLNRLENSKDLMKSFNKFGFVRFCSDEIAETFYNVLRRVGSLNNLHVEYTNPFSLSDKMSTLKEGRKAYNKDGGVVFDLDNYINPDILFIGSIQDFETYFDKPNLKRANIQTMLRSRNNNKSVTILSSRKSFFDVFKSGEYDSVSDSFIDYLNQYVVDEGLINGTFDTYDLPEDFEEQVKVKKKYLKKI